MALAVVAVAAMLVGCGGERPAVTVYSAPGLGGWYASQFQKFTEQTGIRVTLFEAGSGEVVSRLNSGAVWDSVNGQAAEGGRSPQPADLLVTLPPFIQKAATAGLLQPRRVDAEAVPPGEVGPDGMFVSIARTALCFIANPAATPKPASWEDLLSPALKGRLQYSTPGEAGDGTALLILLQHLLGKRGALDYLKRLQANNVGPAPSTAGLQSKVSSGELLVANGDVQMNLAAINNDGADFAVFVPAMPDGSRTTVSLPYVAGVTASARHPEEAGRLLEFLLAEPAQQAVAGEAFGIPVRTSIPAPAATAALAGVRLWEPDWNAVLGELEADLAAYREAIG